MMWSSESPALETNVVRVVARSRSAVLPRRSTPIAPAIESVANIFVVLTCGFEVSEAESLPGAQR